MSIDSHIELEYQAAERPSKPASGLNVLTALLNFGWTLDNSCGHIEYLPPGAEAGDQEYVPLAAQAQVLRELGEREERGEYLMTSLTWRSTGFGGFLFLYPKDRKLVLSLTTLRRGLRGLRRYSDVNWYIRRLVPALERNRLDVFRIEYFHDW